MDNSFVLIYHRVVEIDPDPQRLAVSPLNFFDHLNYLKSRFNVVSLSELAKRIRRKESLKNCIAITFDDGYADNLHFALPLLREFRLPATFFITAGMINSDKCFWWDELERIFFPLRAVNPHLNIKVSGTRYSRVLKDQNDAETTYRKIRNLLKTVPHKERMKVISKLAKWGGYDVHKNKNNHQILSKRELKQLASGEFIEIGSHSYTHTVLSCDPTRLKKEIFFAKKKLEKIIEKRISGFSYPFGQVSDFNDAIVEKVKKAGFHYAVSNIQENFSHESDLFKIPRRLVRDWELSEFKKRIDDFV